MGGIGKTPAPGGSGSPDRVELRAALDRLMDIGAQIKRGANPRRFEAALARLREEYKDAPHLVQMIDEFRARPLPEEPPSIRPPRPLREASREPRPAREPNSFGADALRLTRAPEPSAPAKPVGRLAALAAKVRSLFG